MAIKTILFVLFFAVCTGGALFAPILGVLGYVGHYCIGPERQWWAAPIRGWGIRFSYTLALLTAVGIVLNLRKLRFGKSILYGQEKLLLLFLGIVWLSVAMGETTVGRYTIVDHPSIKFTKIVIFALMLTHVVTNMKDLDRLFWVLIIGALILGLQAYDTPRRAFTSGRLESVGGPDFRNANTLGGYLAAMLFLIGVQFFRSKWKGKAICLLAGVFALNAIILTRSRGAVVGISAGALVALLLVPKRHRVKIIVGLIIAGLGGLYLTDPQFRERTSTIARPEDERDRSSAARLEIWSASVRMLKDRPWGVGVGNFHQSIGRYDQTHVGRDAHSTYLRCATELGLPGILLFVILIANAVHTLRRIMKQARELPERDRDRILWMSYGLATGLAALLAYGITGTVIYMEGLWWLLLMPVCLQRSLENLQEDLLPSKMPYVRPVNATKRKKVSRSLAGEPKG